MNKWYLYWHTFVLRGWRPYFWLGIAIFFLYGKTLAFRLTYFDDDILLGENFWLLKNIGNLLTLFTKDVFMQSPQQMLYYRPLVNLSFMLDAHLFGSTLFMYHVTNIIIHAIAAILVFAFLEQLSIPRSRAFLLSLIFAVHPALSQAVAWIPGRNDSILAVFILASFIFLARYLVNFQLRDISLHLLFFSLALFTKETAVAFVPLFILYSVVYKAKNTIKTPIIPLLIGWITTGLLWAFMRTAVAKISPQPHFLNSAFMSALEKSKILIIYLGKALLPFNLSGFPIIQDMTILYGIIAAFLVGSAFFLVPKSYRRYAFFGLAWFFIALTPQFLSRESISLEHRLYVPIIGIIIMLAGLERKYFGIFKRTIAPGCCAVIVLFSGITFVHSDIFMNRLQFWENAVRSSPHSYLAHGMLAQQYLGLKNYVLSERELRASLQLKPNDSATHCNYGILLTEMERWKDAEQEFTTALTCYPANWAWVTYYNYGMLFYMTGRNDQAKTMWLKAIAANPEYKIAYKTLAAYYWVIGDREKMKRVKDVMLEKFNYPLSLPDMVPANDKKWFYSFGKYL